MLSDREPTLHAHVLCVYLQAACTSTPPPQVTSIACAAPEVTRAKHGCISQSRLLARIVICSPTHSRFCRSPLHYVHSLAFSPGGGFLAVGNARGRAVKTLDTRHSVKRWRYIGSRSRESRSPEVRKEANVGLVAFWQHAACDVG
eukprot:574613-Pelagomonas_calceolata.AAC.2